MSLVPRHTGVVLTVVLTGACQSSDSDRHASAESDSAVAARTLVVTVDSARVASASLVDSAKSSKLNDWLIVPGIRIGPVTARSTEADLKATVGTDQVVRDSVFWFEGEYRPATVLFPKDSLRRLSIVWRDEETWSKPERIALE